MFLSCERLKSARRLQEAFRSVPKAVRAGDRWLESALLV